MVHLCPYFFSRQSVGMWMIIFLWDCDSTSYLGGPIMFVSHSPLSSWRQFFISLFLISIGYTAKVWFWFPPLPFPHEIYTRITKTKQKKKIKLVRFHPFYSLIDMQQVKRRRKCATPDQYSLWPSSRSPFAWMEYNIWKKNVKKLCSFISFQLLSPSFLFLTDHRPS